MEEICGDIRLSARDRVRYILKNAWRNLSFGGPRTQPFWGPRAGRVSPKNQSPSRLLTELFFAEKLPTLLPKRPLEILEIGCGSGSLAVRLAGLGIEGNYTGVDLKNRFRLKPGDLPALSAHFVEIDAHAYEAREPIDLLISHSALEHIPNDKALIKRLSGFMAKGGVEVHALPAGSAIWTYLWHGYRQYTPSSLADRFGEGTEIYRLGGAASFLLHFLFITPEHVLGSFVRSRAPRLYNRALTMALAADRILPFWPTAYIVVRRH